MLYFLFILSLGFSLAAFVGILLTDILINKAGATVKDVLYIGGMCLIPVFNVLLVGSLLLALTQSVWSKPYKFVERKVQSVLEIQLWPRRK